MKISGTLSNIPRKHFFDIPEGMIYLDGNSLGPLPKGVSERVAGVISEEWGKKLVTGWNAAGWMAQPTSVADRLGRLIGAPKGTCVLGDTLSIKVHQMLSAALSLRPDRKTVLSDSGNFPTDLYMAQGLLRQLDQGHDLKVVAPEDVAEAISEDVAAVMLTHVDYRTGRMHDMTAITERAQGAGAVMLWDLAHSAGAVPVDLAGSNAEFAAGCTYKYLNAGPGAPAFIYVRADIADTVFPSLSGWLGHEAPFSFDQDYRPGAGIERFRVGTPPVLQVAALDAALAAWEGIDMSKVRAASIALTEQFIAEVEARVPDLKLASPRDAAIRGSQVSFHFKEGYAAIQALIVEGIIGDFRAPDIMRFGVTPLYLDASDITAAVDGIARVIGDRLWDRQEYRERKRVT